MAPRAGVDVHVDDGGADLGVADFQPGLLAGLPQGGIGQWLARVDVAAGLQPEAESLVAVQHHAARADHDGAGGDVDRIGVLVERVLEGQEVALEEFDRELLAVVHGRAGDHGSEQFVGIHRLSHRRGQDRAMTRRVVPQVALAMGLAVMGAGCAGHAADDEAAVTTMTSLTTATTPPSPPTTSAAPTTSTAVPASTTTLRRTMPPPSTMATRAAPAEIEIRYRLERRVDDEATAGFEAVVESTLTDERGWSGAAYRFVRDDGEAAYRIVLAEGGEIDALCLPYDTYGKYSCQNGPVVALNADRWRTSTDKWTGNLDDYRRMLVNHEVGHLLGLKHPRPQCPAAGRPATIMNQQATELDGCLPNPWPLDAEVSTAARHDRKLAPGPGE